MVRIEKGGSDNKTGDSERNEKNNYHTVKQL